MVERKPADYSASAENLCNPVEVEQKLQELHIAQEQAKLFEGALKENENYQEMKRYEQQVTDITAQVKDMVDALGSYQDIETGSYAVKYRRVTKSYRAEPFIENYPKYAPAVIENSVNVKALEGILKGGLLSIEDLKANGVVEETSSFAYYVR